MNTATAITSKSTKAEILEAYQEAINRPPATWADVYVLVRQSISAIRREVPLLVKDCYRLGQWARKQVNLLIEDRPRPFSKA